MRSPIHILYLEDEANDLELAASLLRQENVDYEMVHVQTRDEYLTALEQQDLDLILGDYSLPSFDGLTALRMAKERRPEVPFILLSGTVGEELAIDSLKAGATDYVLKQRLSRLVPAVRRALREAEEQEETKRAQEALAESERRYRRIVKAVTDYIYTVHVEEGRPVGTTHGDACFAVTGYTTEDLTADSGLWLRMIPEEDRELVMQRASQILAGEAVSPFAHRILRKDGEERWVANSMVPHLDRAGRLISYDGLVRDVTERKAAEEDRRRLAIAINQAAEIVVVTGADGAIQYVNPAFERVTGFSREEALGQNPRILKSGKQDGAFYEELWNTISNGGVWSGHFVNMKKDGSLYEEDASISPVRDDGGKIVSYVAVQRDVTEQAQLERRLRQAQRLEALGTLAGGIAHDFNNILTAIVGYGQLAAEALHEDTPERADVEQILGAAARAKNLIRQILAFSRQTEQERQPVRLHLVLGEVLALLRPSLPATIEIQSNVNIDCGPVYADPTQMHQVIMNLCTNAFHAMEGNGGVLGIDLRGVEVDGKTCPGLGEGSFAKLTVKDTGHGMDGPTMERVFDPFFTTKEESKGTGMGLSTVHGIVKACGGTISVDSVPGKGTTFDLYLPLAQTTTQKREPEKETPPGGNERVLVIDDEEDLANLIGRQLASLGYDATVKTSSVEGLEEFRTRPDHFDLIITDLVMPEMTGRELIREVVRLREDISVIAISGGIKRLSTGEAGERLADALLEKPFDLRALGLAVRNVLNGTKRASDSLQANAPDSCASHGEMQS